MKNKKGGVYKSGRKRSIMKTINIAQFRKENVDEILDIVGAHTDNKGNIIHKDKLVLCDGCGTTINKERLGSVIRTSPEHFICDDPICFYKFYSRMNSKKKD